MVDVIPLAVWYPSMHAQWVARLAALASVGVKVLYPLSGRDGWTIHHSVGGAATDPLAYARQVANQHWDAWRRPGGYNFMVATDGDLYEMCGFVRLGAHAGSTLWNRKTLGLCFQGDYRNVSPEQVMVETATELIHTTDIPDTQWTHKQVRPTPTTCPGSKVEALLPLEDDMPITDDEIKRIAEASAAEVLGTKWSDTASVLQAIGRTYERTTLGSENVSDAELSRAVDYLLTNLPPKTVSLIAQKLGVAAPPDTPV